MRSKSITDLLKLSRPHLFLMENCPDMKEFMKFHCQVITNGFAKEPVFLSTLLSFAAISTAGDLGYARSVFDRIDAPNIFMYNTMIRGYAWSSTPQEALSIYNKMLRSGLSPNVYTFPFVNKACSRIINTGDGKTIHGSIIKLGHVSDVYVSNSLMHMYESFGFSEAVMKLFREIPEPDVISWNVVIGAFAQSGRLNEVLIAFGKMCFCGVEPNSVTVLGLLSACCVSGDLYLGMLIHLYIIKNDLQITTNLGNGLLDMYTKFGDIDSARKLFSRMPVKTIFSWTSMIDGLVRIADVENACLLFNQMPERDITSWNAMLNGFIMTGDMNSADEHFKAMQERDLVSWNSMIVGYTQNKKFAKSLELYREMHVLGENPDRITVVSVLSVCGFMGALDHGEMTHCYMEKQNLKGEEVEVALMDMYCKSGATEKALAIFHGILNKSVLAWSALIVGLATNGLSKDALTFFSQMQNVGIKPNEITFIGVLCGCSHAGLVEEGRRFFGAMSDVYNIQPRSEHYGCMVDILCRAGHLKEAESFIENMPIKPDVGVWGALLGACKMHGEFQMGERIAKILTGMDQYHSGRYVALSNMYAAEKRWLDVEKVRKTMKTHGVQKTPGFSLIELQGEMHQFFAGDTSHPNTQEIYFTLEEMTKRLKDAGQELDLAY